MVIGVILFSDIFSIFMKRYLKSLLNNIKIQKKKNIKLVIDVIYVFSRETFPINNVTNLARYMVHQLPYICFHPPPRGGYYKFFDAG